MRAVHDHVVLDVGAFADLDGGLVAAQYGTEPNARAGADLDVTDEDCSRRDVCVGMHCRALPAELELHWPL